MSIERMSQATFDSAASELAEVARLLTAMDLVPWRGGNISTRVGNQMVISRSRSEKGVASSEMFVATGIYEDDEQTPYTTTALEIHRAIYKATDASAIVHAHPYYATLLTFFVDEIGPVDENGFLTFGMKPIPVVAAPKLFGWNLVDEELANGLLDSKAVMLKWHGCFCKGTDIKDAFHTTRTLENTARFVLDVPRYREHFDNLRFPPEEVAAVPGGILKREAPPAWAKKK